jgi:hypothetical protein
MKYKISLDGNNHLFRKMNVMTHIDDISQYDIMKCSICGIEGKCRDLNTVEVPRMTKKAMNCNQKVIKPTKQSIADALYNSGEKTEHKCSKCQNILNETAMYIEEGTNIILAQLVCACGHIEYLDVTERESNKKKK